MLIVGRHIEGSRPDWCISRMIYSGDTPFWPGTLDMQWHCKVFFVLSIVAILPELLAALSLFTDCRMCPFTNMVVGYRVSTGLSQCHHCWAPHGSKHWSPRWPSGKASASRAEGPGFESRLRRDFFGVESYQWLKNWRSSGYPARRLAL